MKSWQILIVLVLSALALSAGYLYTQVRAIDVEQLSDDLWVLRGFGGNTAVLKTRSGTVIVDTMTFGIQGDRIREIAQDLTGMGTSMIINTHYHLDHTHGNRTQSQEECQYAGGQKTDWPAHHVTQHLGIFQTNQMGPTGSAITI